MCYSGVVSEPQETPAIAEREALERMNRRWDVLAMFPPAEGLTPDQARRMHAELGLSLARLFVDPERRSGLERELAHRLEQLVAWTASVGQRESG